MTRASRRIGRAVARVEALGRAGADLPTYADRLAHELRSLIPHAAACVVTLDPATGLLTGTYKSGGLADAHDEDDLWARLEYGSDDPSRMSMIARRPLPAMACSHLPGGTTDSVRMRELVGPAGYGDELRMVARDAVHGWGGVNLFRADDEAPFDEDDVQLLAAISRTVSDGLRAGLMVQAADAGTPRSGGPIVLLVGKDDEPRQVSFGGDELLREITDEVGRSPVESIVHGLVAATHQFTSGATSALPRIRLRSPAGRWLVAHGAPLAGGGSVDDVVIVIDEAHPPEIVSILASTFGLTPREREVTELVLRGTDTKGIASRLAMSAYTVQDHLKSIFEKAGVRSRRELMARVFFDQYVPRITHGVTPTGWFRSAPEATQA